MLATLFLPSSLFSPSSLGLALCILLGLYALSTTHVLPLRLFTRWLPLKSQLSQPNPAPWTLDYAAVQRARFLLTRLKLPMELTLSILDAAEYWPARTFSTPRAHSVQVVASMFRSSAAGLFMDIDLARDAMVAKLRRRGETPRVKALQFRVRSRDQGWTTEPTRGSFSTSSWVEVSLLRGGVEERVPEPGPGTEGPASGSGWLDGVFETPREWEARVRPRGWRLVPRPERAEPGPQGGEGGLAWYLQGNRVATQGRAEEYSVLWTKSGYEGNEGCGTGEGFLDELDQGDRLLIWARAKWPGWQCIVESVDVTVFYGFS